MAKSLVLATPAAEMVLAAGVDVLLSQIRAEWRAKARMAPCCLLQPKMHSIALRRCCDRP